MLLEAAIHGQGVALTWAALVEEDLRAGRLVRLFDRALEGSMSYFAVSTPAAARKPKVTAFRDWLVEEGRAFTQGVSLRSEEHTSELQSLMRISYAVFCLKKKK